MQWLQALHISNMALAAFMVPEDHKSIATAYACKAVDNPAPGVLAFFYTAAA